MIREAIVGIGIAITVFFAYLGTNVLPLVLLIGLLFAISVVVEKRGVVSTGHREHPSSHRVEFENIGGQESAKRELMEALDFLRHRDKIKSLGIRPLKGILLTGPPGTGKTLMAKAAATYTDSVFVSASGSEFVEMYVGVGASRVRDLFKKARSLARKEGKDSAIVFIDEIDVIGGKRGGGQGHQEYDQTLNQLLTEMDGMQTTSNPLVLVVAATNRVDMLDPALLRPGRFDRQIKVDLPDKEGRLHILKIQTANKPLAKDVDLESIAKESYGFSGAQLESLTNEAAILALREDKQEIETRHFRDAVDKVLLGEKTGKRPSSEELLRVSVHELGHAIASESVRPGSVAHITIAPRGNALGFVRQVPQQDSYLYTKEQLEGQMKVALAGAVAEELIFGNRSTGASNDFMQASNLARTIVSCGLSSLGIVDADNLQRNVLDEEIRKILSDIEKLTIELLEPFKDGIRQLSQTLVEEESMTGDAFRQWLSRQKPKQFAHA
ncbi:AAA family ATPase [Effusibacillus lacus]|uniref:ATPase n=1 Tax=Effusibacillus lacus TaxID=1348429 RepID=A0A292YMS9_9BACL|nr:AAA family ATPase [Effusibacillus lacus]TCS75346.1 ATP-dependent metalloprotease FtsH [Effusibacillus lacus]GAX89780.1 ATPase [Effusibacillus lacus]